MIALFSKYSYLSVWSETIAWGLCLILLIWSLWLYLKLKERRKDPHWRVTGNDSVASNPESASPEDGLPASTSSYVVSNISSEALNSDQSTPKDKKDEGYVERSISHGGEISLYTLRSFLRLSEVYRLHYDDLVKVARRKLTAGQAEELITSLKSDKMTKEPKAEFLKRFDEAVGLVIPNFTTKLNLILDPEKQFPNTGDGLDAETRIAAMTSLGETDSQVIADTLGL